MKRRCKHQKRKTVTCRVEDDDMQTEGVGDDQNIPAARDDYTTGVEDEFYVTGVENVVPTKTALENHRSTKLAQCVCRGTLHITDREDDSA